MTILYKLIAPEQYGEVLDFFNDHFMPENLLNKYFGCTGRTDVVDKMILDHLKENLSWCAIEERSDKMIGMCINRERSLDILPDTPPTYEDYIQRGFSKELALVFIFLGNMLNTKQLLVEYNETKMFEPFAAAVLPHYRSSGICTELIKRSLEHAAILGYTFSGATCSSFYSQRVVEKCGYQMIKEFDYATCVHPVTNTHILMEDPHKSSKCYIKNKL
jgi:hypothetical protein